MKKFILSIIVFLCVYPVANANNGIFKIKLISESEKSSIRPTQSAFIVTQKSLRGLGFEYNHKFKRNTLCPNRQRKWKIDLGSKYI